MTRPQLVEYFAEAAVSLTYVVQEETSGVARLGYHSRESMARVLGAAEEVRLKAEAEIQRMAKFAFQQGLTFAAMGRIDESIQEFSVAIERDPTYAIAYANRGVAYITQKKYNKAFDDLKKAVDLNPKDHNAFYNIAVLYTLRAST